MQVTYIFVHTITQEHSVSSEKTLHDLRVYLATVLGIQFVVLSDIQWLKKLSQCLHVFH